MLLGLPDSELESLLIYSLPKSLLDLVTSQPTLETIGNCSARVDILNHNQVLNFLPVILFIYKRTENVRQIVKQGEHQRFEMTSKI